MANTKAALIIGIGGQDGAYLAKLLLEKGYRVHGTSRGRDLSKFPNLNALQICDRVGLHTASLNDFRAIAKVLDRVAPDEIYNLSSQSSVGLSFERPVETVESTVTVTVNILEAMRSLHSSARFFSASSGECFGSTHEGPADENTPFRPCSPYGVGKAAAHWLVANYRSAYGLFACSGILFNHESPLRPSRFVTRKIVRGTVDIAQRKAKTLHLGDLDVERDWGWAPEYVDAMWRMLQQSDPEDFVIATGRSHRLSEFVALAFAAVGLDWREYVVSDQLLRRPIDIRVNAGNPGKAQQKMGWAPQVDFHTLVKRLVAAELKAGDAGVINEEPPV